MEEKRVRYIAHLDLDCFYVSVERLFDPSLRGKPVVVGASKESRGVVTSASYEARAYGVRAAMSSRKAFELCPHLIAVRGSLQRYTELSAKIHDRLCQIAPVVEQASIDEFYLDFTGCERLYDSDIPGFMRTVQLIVRDEYGLPCTIGLGANKTIAKIAANLAKPEGLLFVPPGTEKDFLAPLPVETLPGIGAVTEKLMRQRGFQTVADLQHSTLARIKKSFGKHGEQLLWTAQGNGSVTLHTSYERKSIGKEETFSSNTASVPFLEKELFLLTEKVCATLRRKGLKAKKVSIKIRYADFTTISREDTIDPTDDDPTIFAVGRHLFDLHYTKKRPVRLLGISVSSLVAAASVEPQLFPSKTANEKLLKAVDSLRSKFGTKVIGFARGASEQSS